MQLTEAELEEGRRLLAKVCDDPTDWPPENADMIDWLWEHRVALLARPEEIAREAVREFALELLEKAETFEGDECWLSAVTAVRTTDIETLARARGVNLDEKPVGEAEGGES